ncbi:MAG: hypothetical protein AAGF44_06590 [Pseudomonadota bacterium]
MSLTLLAVSALAIAAFAAAFHVSGIIDHVMRASRTAREAGAVMSDKTLDDEVKEKRVQQASLGLFASFGQIFLRSLAVLALPGLILWGADAAGLVTFQEIEDFFLSWEVIIGTTILLVVLIWWQQK